MVEGAFRPLRCVAEIWDYDDKLRFKVFDENNNSIIERPLLVLRELADEKTLSEFLRLIRTQVEEKGFTLESWPIV